MSRGPRVKQHDIAPAMRGAFLKALDIYRKRHGKTIPEAMCDWLEQKPVEMLNAISKFSIRESNVQASVNVKDERQPSDTELAHEVFTLLAAGAEGKTGRAGQQFKKAVDSLTRAADASTKH